MPLAVYPLPVTSSPSTLAKTMTIPGTSALYEGVGTFSAGTYAITCISSTNANVTFLDASGVIVSAVTVAGTVTINLAREATKVMCYINTGTNIIVSMAITGTSVSASTSGVLATVTNSQTYTDATYTTAYAVVVGGGGGGGNGRQYGSGGGGGGSGGITGGLVYFPATISIGSAGAGANLAGGSTTVNSAAGTLTANGGGSGGSGYQGGNVGGGGGGTPGGGNGGDGRGDSAGNPGNASSQSPYVWVKSGTTGGGGGGGGGSSNTPGGSGIGTGGGGGGGAASGYGAGGGGGPRGADGGGASGSPGVVYLIKF